jgi:hypothetical protein
MKKLLAAIVAGMFALSTAPAVLAAKHEMEKKERKKETKKAAPKKASPLAMACKGKKAGEEVTVGGKKMKCPAPKKAPKKTAK